MFKDKKGGSAEEFKDLVETIRGCLSLVDTLAINTEKVRKPLSLKIDASPNKQHTDFTQKSDFGCQTSPKLLQRPKSLKFDQQLMHSYRLNFPIKDRQAALLMKELLVRLTVKGAMFGNLIDFHGELFESQIVSVLKHKLLYESEYRMRKTVRYMFQITPFDSERRRSRIELVEAVENRLGEEHFLLSKRGTCFRKLTKEEVELAEYRMNQNPMDYQCCSFDQAVRFLESVLGKDDVIEFLCLQLEQKRTLISINIYQGLGINNYSRLRSKSINSTTETGPIQQEFLLEDCEIECVPYEILFSVSAS